jgi:hypothetical protein
MKTNEDFTPLALREVWSWKESVYRDTVGRAFSEVQNYFTDGMKEAANILGAEIVVNGDGSYSFKR